MEYESSEYDAWIVSQEMRIALEYEYECTVKAYIERLTATQQQELYQRIQSTIQQLPQGHSQFDSAKMPAYYTSLPDSLFRPTCQMFGTGCCHRPVKHLISFTNYQWLGREPCPNTIARTMKDINLTLCEYHLNTGLLLHVDHILQSFAENTTQECRDVILEDAFFSGRLGDSIIQKSVNGAVAFASTESLGRPRKSLFKDSVFDPNCRYNVQLDEQECKKPGTYRLCRTTVIQTHVCALYPDFINLFESKLCIQDQNYSTYFLIDSITINHSLFIAP